MRISVAIAGGGLAGLTCALSLGRAGFDVTVYESSQVVGGKAGVRTETDLLRPNREFPLPCEHGPHFVAAWYSSTLRLLQELEIADRLVGYPSIRYLLPTPPSARVPRAVEMGASLRTLPRLVAGRLSRDQKGPLSWRVSSQAASMAFDLLVNLSRIEAAADVTLAEYVSSRWYGNDDLMAAADDQVLRASAISANEVSLQTMARLMTLWFQYPQPFLSVFDSDLATALIDPLTQAVETVARIRTMTPIQGLAHDDEGRITGLRHDDGSVSHADVVVAAVPCEVLSRWLPGEPVANELSGVSNLRVAPMSAIQLLFEDTLRGVPAGVFYLWRSEPAMNAIDLSQVWRRLGDDKRTFLSVVISDYAAIRELDDTELIALTLQQLSRCIPDVKRVKLASAVAKTNAREPLFINTVSSWTDRPTPAHAYARGSLYLAGDFTQTPIDIACMEGAVASGMTAAEAIALRHARPPGLRAVLPQPPTRWRQFAYRAMRAGLAPVTAATAVARPSPER